MMLVDHWQIAEPAQEESTGSERPVRESFVSVKILSL